MAATVEKHVHSVFDEASLARQREGHAREAYTQQQHDALVAMQETCRYLHESKMIDFEHQAGRSLPYKDFEEKVRKLVPAVIFRSMPNQDPATYADYPYVRVMALAGPGEPLYIASYPDKPIIPEYTVVLMKTVRTAVPLARDANGNLTVNAKDFPRQTQVGEETFWNPITGTWETAPTWAFDGPTPLDATTEEPCGQLPGWRSACLLLVWKGLTTPAAVDRVFGASNRAVWSAKTGAQRLVDVQV